MTRGKYIVLEGLDGSGKSTQFDKLLNFFDKKFIGVREPGGTQMGEQLRTLIKNKEVKRAPRTNLYLFSAVRVDLIERKIRPTLAKGMHILSDRNWLSTIGHQAGGEGVGLDEIFAVSKLATQEFFQPDLIIFIDISPEICLERMAASSAHGGKDYFDTQAADFFNRSREKYLQYIKTFKNYVVINGERPIDEVFLDIRQHIEKII